MNIEGTKEESNEWSITTSGEWIGDLYKSRPDRFSCSRGYVTDTTKPWEFQYNGRGGGAPVFLKATTYREAMKELAAVLAR